MSKQRIAETLGTTLYSPSPPQQSPDPDLPTAPTSATEAPGILEQLVMARLKEYISAATMGRYMTPDFPVSLSLKLSDGQRIDLLLPSYEAALTKAALTGHANLAGVEGLTAKSVKVWLVPWNRMDVEPRLAMQYAKMMFSNKEV